MKISDEQAREMSTWGENPTIGRVGSDLAADLLEAREELRRAKGSKESAERLAAWIRALSSVPPSAPSTEAAVRAGLAALTDEQRAAIFRGYCRSCGTPDPRCQCWNDE